MYTEKDKELKELVKELVKEKLTDAMIDPDLERSFNHHSPKDEATGQKHTDFRAACKQLAYYIKEVTPPGREQSLSLTHLEEVMFWSNAGIARNS